MRSCPLSVASATAGPTLQMLQQQTNKFLTAGREDFGNDEGINVIITTPLFSGERRSLAFPSDYTLCQCVCLSEYRTKELEVIPFW